MNPMAMLPYEYQWLTDNILEVHLDVRTRPALKEVANVQAAMLDWQTKYPRLTYWQARLSDETLILILWRD